jgi:RNA polymerase subunit RPABC4/transcription elongation factor Spt4
MLAKEETQTGLSAEIKIIPIWAWVLAGVAFVAAQWFFNIAVVRHPQPHPIPAWARPFLGLLLGLVAGCYFLLIGYINRDAKRRGMSPILWTILAIVVPNALGIILYFLLRLPLRRLCPQCGHTVQPGFSFCPHCSYKLSPTCPQCQRAVDPNDIFCPYCGTSMRNAAGPVSGPPTTIPG